jgi:hypothetical protein
MKTIAFILSIYILSVLVMPCADNINYGSVDSNNEVLASSHDHNESGHEDDCPPFCICSCCGSIATYSSIETLSNLIRIGSKEYLSTYKFDYSFDYSEGIWHPPANS